MATNPEPPTDDHGPAEFEKTYTLDEDQRAAIEAGETVSFWHSVNEVIHLEAEGDG